MDRLKKYDSFIRFQKLRRQRAMIALFFITLFWGFTIFANNPNADRRDVLIVQSLLIIASLCVLYTVFLAFIKRPLIEEGIVASSRDKKRTVKRAGDIENRILKEYLVKTSRGEYWGRNIASYNGSDYRELKVGDEVIWFSYGRGNSYLVQSEM